MWCIYVCVNFFVFFEYVSATNWQNWMISDKAITNLKRLTFFSEMQWPRMTICMFMFISSCLASICCVFGCIAVLVNSVEVKTEADSNDITECSHDDKPTIGMFGYSLHFDIFSSFSWFSLIHCSQCFCNLIVRLQSCALCQFCPRSLCICLTWSLSTFFPCKHVYSK